MNEQDVIDLINQVVVENHNREITGSELNAVLLAMVQQPNDAIGDLDSLSTGVNTDLVSAINWLITQINSGAVIHSGRPDPNITPPSSFAVGDLYSRLDVMSNPMQLYIYTGVEWALLGGDIQAIDVSYNNTTSDLDADNVQDAIDTEIINDRERTILNATNIVVPFPRSPIITASSIDPDEARIAEHGNPVWDENTQQYIIVYSGSRTSGRQYNVWVYWATSPDGKTWTKQGKCTTTPSEDPYLFIEGNTYYLFTEEKQNASVTHKGIGLYKGSSMSSLVYQGLILEAKEDTWFDFDVSSPTVYKEDGTYYLFYEGRGGTSSNTTQQGAIGIATTDDIDGEWINQSEIAPHIYGNQYNTDTPISWASHLVPDDIIKINDNYYLSIHAFNGVAYVQSILVSKTIDGVYSDFKFTWLDSDLSPQNSNGNGLVFFPLNGLLKVIIALNSSIYLADLGGTNADYFSYRTHNNNEVNYEFGIANALRNEIIELQPTSGSRVIALKLQNTRKFGVLKIIKNVNNYSVLLKPDSEVTLDGSNSSVTIPPYGFHLIYQSGLNIWKTLFKGLGIDVSDYNNLINKPDLSNFVESDELSEVAFSNSYNDLDDKPLIIQEGSDSEETIKYLSVKEEEGTNEETIYFVPKSQNIIYNGQLTVFKYPSNTEAYPEENDLVEGFMNEVIVDPITEEETYILWFARGKYLGTGSFFNIDSYELLNGSAEWE